MNQNTDNLITFPVQHNENILEAYEESGQALVSFIKGMFLSIEQKDILVELIMKHLQSAADYGFQSGFEMVKEELNEFLEGGSKS